MYSINKLTPHQSDRSIRKICILTCFAKCSTYHWTILTWLFLQAHNIEIPSRWFCVVHPLSVACLWKSLFLNGFLPNFNYWLTWTIRPDMLLIFEHFFIFYFFFMFYDYCHFVNVAGNVLDGNSYSYCNSCRWYTWSSRWSTWEPMAVKLSKRYPSYKMQAICVRLLLKFLLNGPRKTTYEIF